MMNLQADFSLRRYAHKCYLQPAASPQSTAVIGILAGSLAYVHHIWLWSKIANRYTAAVVISGHHINQLPFQTNSPGELRGVFIE